MTSKVIQGAIISIASFLIVYEIRIKQLESQLVKDKGKQKDNVDS